MIRFPRVVFCVVCLVVLASAAGCGQRARTQAGPPTLIATPPEQETDGEAPVLGPPMLAPGGEEISLTSPRVILGPVFEGCAALSTHSAAGTASLAVEIGCDPGRTTTVTLRNDGAELLPEALLEGTVLLDLATSPPPDLVSVFTTSSTGNPCSSIGSTFSCTLGGVEPGSSTEVTVSFERSENLTARFDLALSLTFGNS